MIFRHGREPTTPPVPVTRTRAPTMKPIPATMMNGMTRVDAHGQCRQVAAHAVIRMRVADVTPISWMCGYRLRCVDMSVLIRVVRKSHSVHEAMSRCAAENSVGRQGAGPAGGRASEIVPAAPVKVQVGATATTGDLQDAGMGEAREEGLLYSLSHKGSCVGQQEKRLSS